MLAVRGFDAEEDAGESVSVCEWERDPPVCPLNITYAAGSTRFVSFPEQRRDSDLQVVFVSQRRHTI